MWPPNDPDAKEYVSVTTALNALPKEALPYWAAKVTAETAVDKLELLNNLAADDPEAAIKWLKGAPWGSRDKAADAGTAIHEIVEFDAVGNTEGAEYLMSQLNPVGRAKATQARDFFSRGAVSIEHVEFVTYHTDLMYAGTGDFIVKMETVGLPGVLKQEQTAILDLKTGKSIWPEAALQIAAYRYASHMVDLSTAEMKPMPEVDGGLVLHVTEKSWSLIPVDVSEASFEIFKIALALSGELPLDRMMVGTPILRGRG